MAIKEQITFEKSGYNKLTLRILELFIRYLIVILQYLVINRKSISQEIKP